MKAMNAMNAGKDPAQHPSTRGLEPLCLCYDLPPVVTISAALLQRLQLAELTLANVRAEIEGIRSETDAQICLSRLSRHFAEFDHGRADAPADRAPRRYHDDG